MENYLEKGHEQEEDKEIKVDRSTEEMREGLSSCFDSFETNDRKRLSKALDLSLYLHSDQKDRSDGPYVNHILRVAGTVINTFKIRDVDVIAASFLHDSVEDQSEKISSLADSGRGNHRDNAFSYIEENFGEGTSSIVSAVTNPEELDVLAEEEKNQAYVDHVLEAISDPKVFYVKFADFIDNALGIEGIGDPVRQRKLAKKYLPLYGIFLDRVSQDDIVIPDEVKEEITAKIVHVDNFVKSIVID